MKIDYNHSNNIHTQDGPRAVMPRILAETNPKSILDVGCGTGTWLKAAAELGISDFYGVDGVNIPAEKLLIAADRFAQQDLTKSWGLGRRFDVVLCLEVGEHLDELYAGNLIDALVKHTDLIYFSAACPGQEGQHHVNCQWPAYWQQLFNQRGFACRDDFRWQIWEDPQVEPWYKQNIFVAGRAPELAGKESRLKAVVHSEMWSAVTPTFEDYLQQIEEGSMPLSWYATVAPHAFLAKFGRYFKRS